jgi:hypothetical protein
MRQLLGAAQRPVQGEIRLDRLGDGAKEASGSLTHMVQPGTEETP